ncbi:unannotated protein [freshwater metagenome]|uniref:Unannotated protein n=1 Tax=freshwater metagenome TaxID=449393 RepID=A0A6J6MTR3_9ZZZZ
MIATSFGPPERTGRSPPVEVLPAVVPLKAPKRVEVIGRPMALAISLVRRVPEAPTKVPAMINRTLLSTYPDAATDKPVNAFSSEITIGTSAPPTGSTKSMPKISESTSRATSNQTWGLMTNHTAPITVKAATSIVTHFPAGIITGREVISSCNFKKVMIDPLNETEPMTTVKTVAASEILFSPPTSRYSITATRAAAPPPTPLNSATSCGI